MKSSDFAYAATVLAVIALATLFVVVVDVVRKRRNRIERPDQREIGRYDWTTDPWLPRFFERMERRERAIQAVVFDRPTGQPRLPL
jgi:hypothetical protein